MFKLLKLLNRKMYYVSILLSITYSVAEYGVSFALAYFGTSPFTLDKANSLLYTVIILYSITLITHYIELKIDGIVYGLYDVQIQEYYFNKIQKMTPKKISDTHTGYIFNLIKDTSTLFIDLLWLIKDTLLPLIIGAIAFAYMAFSQNIIIGTICILISISAITIKYILMKRMNKYEKDTRDKHSKLTGILIDFIQNIFTVRKLNIEDFCTNKLKEKENDYKKSLIVTENKHAFRNSSFHFQMDLIYIIVVFSVILIIKNGSDGLPYLLFYFTLLNNIYTRINGASRLVDTNVKFNIAKNQLESFLESNITLTPIPTWNKLEIKEGIFQYSSSKTKILIPEFILHKGDKISIMGESGQGKSTILNILSGTYLLKQGSFIVDNKKCTNSKIDVVFVSQEVDLFDLSIRENLCLGKDIKEEEILKLFDDAGLMEWYKTLPDGLDTIVGERGVKLSAGQKQRLNIIRGILIDKDVYFFDEPTSNLDSVSEQKITEMIDKYLKDKTYIIVTHRPSLKNLCNKHYLFENHMIKEVTTI